MTALASTSYENMTDTELVTSSVNNALEEMRLEDSGTFDGDSPSDSNEQINGQSCSPPSPDVLPSSYSDDKHIYTNIREMDEINNRPLPPSPSPDDQPKRNLNNGWMEYETDIGRTYFYNSESGRSQWIPPRFIRTPAQVQAFLKATRDEVDEHFCTTSIDHTAEEAPEESAPPVPAPERKSSLHHDFDEPMRLPVEPRVRRESESSPTRTQTAANDGSHHMMTSFSAPTSGIDPLGMAVSSAPSRAPHSSPSTARSQSFKTKTSQLKNVPLPQVLPTTSGFYAPDASQTLDRRIPRTSCSEDYDADERRGSSGEGRDREPVRTIRSGNMEKVQVDTIDLSSRRKREWFPNFMYLTSAHLILYKDEKSAEKYGNHYATPLGVCDLRGATVSWNIDKERKKKKVIQLELSYGQKYLLRTASETETVDWFESLRDVIKKLPAAAPSAGLPMHPSLLDSSCAVVRNPSTLSNRPHSTAILTTTSSRSSARRPDPMAHSSIEVGPYEDTRVSRETILEKLRRFFRTRPTVESLKEKGIYKPEPVFGSTLASICQLECSLVPKFIRTVTELIENKGLEVDGLYRVSGNLSAVQRIRCQVDQDKYTALVSEEDVHVLTGALKLFFRELAEPVFPPTTTKEYLTAIKIQSPKQRFKRFDELLKGLPAENKETLKMLLRHLHRVAAHSDKNRMQAHNLAIMFGPTLFHNGDEKGRKKEPAGKKDKNKNKKEEPAPVQSNSHLAFNMIMQGQIVEYLLNEHSRFEALQGPIITHPT